MKLTTAILALGMTLGTAWGQMPNVLQNTKDKMKGVEQQKINDSNAALGTPSAQTSGAKAGSSPAAVKPVAAKPVAAKPVAAKPVAAKPVVAKPVAAKPVTAPQTAKATPKAAPPAASKTAPQAAAKVAPKAVSKAAIKVSPVKAAVSKPSAGKAQMVSMEIKGNPAEAAKEQKEKPLNLTGRRDPFISPVVSQSATGSGCSTGKRCLAVEQISLKGVVKSETGMIAVVVNALDKAYFLRENDPVFNGYVVKITGDSIIFKETVQDKLGKPFTREVTKKITTPAV